jgi:hypothetical protein
MLTLASEYWGWGAGIACGRTGGQVGALGARDLRKDVSRLVRDARRNVGKLSRAVRRDLDRLQTELTHPAREAHSRARRDPSEGGISGRT